MSLRNVQQNSINQRHMAASRPVVRPSAGFISVSGEWRRNPAWLAMPSVLITDEKICILTAVREKSEYVAMTISGAYTVDWGDGSSPVNVATGGTALYLYSYSAAGLNNTDGPVTFTASGSTVDRNNHGYVNGDIVTFWTVVTTTGITAGQQYYVVNATTNTFQVSATLGGSAITLTNNGSGTLLPYKQAIITITPQAGQNLTNVNLAVRHTVTGIGYYSSGYLDMIASMPNLAAGSTFTFSSQSTVYHGWLERANILTIGACSSLSTIFFNCYNLRSVGEFNTASVTSMTNMFFSCASLSSIPLFNTSANTDFGGMFQGCTALMTAPFLNTSAGTNFGNMFRDCQALRTVPLYNTVSATNMAGTFQNCFSLESVPLFNTAAVTTMNSMFWGCALLKSVPLFNTAACTNMGSMFRSCSSLQTVPLFNTAANTTMAQMFIFCNALRSVPLFNTGLVTSFSEAFYGCLSLQSVPLFNTANVTSMASAFRTCSSLTSVPLFNLAACTNTSNMFRGCAALESVPLFNTAAVTIANEMFRDCLALQSVPALNVTAVSSAANLSNIIFNCPSLMRLQAKDFRFTFTVASCKLAAAELDEIYTNLPTVTAQTITVSGNHGTTGDNPAIATAKGWTVTG